MNVDSVFPKVRAIVADVLMIEEEEVSIHSRLISELGAESIDFLDLVFQLEKQFKIKIPRGQIEKDARGALTTDQFEQKGVITVEGLERLKTYFSEMPADAFKQAMKVNEIPSLFSVETFCKLVIKETQKVDVGILEENPA